MVTAWRMAPACLRVLPVLLLARLDANGQLVLRGRGEAGTRRSTTRRCARPRKSSGSGPRTSPAWAASRPLVTVTGFYVEPFVAALPQPYVFRPAEAEIAPVLEVPVAALLDPTALEIRRIEGREEPILFYRYGDQVIWGATAQILAELLEALGGTPT